MAFELAGDREFDVNGQKYKIKPLTGRSIGKMYSLLKSFSKVKEGSEDSVLEALDEETMGKFYDIALETMIKSYPAEDKAKMEAWVSQNLLKLLEPILKVNLPDQK